MHRVNSSDTPPAAPARAGTGRERDLTQGSLGWHIWRLSWPNALSQALFMFPGLYDAVWLGQLGPQAQAAAGLTMSVRFTLISVLMALSLGSGAVVARHIGAKEQRQANQASAQAVMLMVVSSGALGLFGLAFAQPLLKLAGADEATLPWAVRYARIIFGGLVAIELVPSVGFMLSAAGAPQIMLQMALISTVTLVIGEPLLVRRMGLEGAALALTGSNFLGMLWGFILLLTGRAPVRVNGQDMRLNLPVMARILRVAVPAVAQRGTPNLAMSLLTRLVASHGPSLLAAWIIVQRIFGFAIIPGMGLSRTAPAMVGQNLGAAQPERAERGVGLILRAAALFGGLVLGLVALLAPQVMGLFSADPETIRLGAYAMRLLGVGYLAQGLSFVFDSAQGGAGDTVSPMVINLLSLWVVQVPLAYALSRWTALGAEGIWAALVVGWLVQTTLLWLRFAQGRWKLKRI